MLAAPYNLSLLIQALLTALQCASHLAVAHNVTTPVLVLTDNALLRRDVAAGRFKGVVGPKVCPLLFKRGDNGVMAKVRSLMLQFALFVIFFCKGLVGPTVRSLILFAAVGHILL